MSQLGFIQGLLEAIQSEIPALTNASLIITTEALPAFNGQRAIVDARSFPRIASDVNTYHVTVTARETSVSEEGTSVSCIVRCSLRVFYSTLFDPPPPARASCTGTRRADRPSNNSVG